MEQTDYTIKQVTIDDYDDLLKLWNSTEQSRRALNPVDDSREGMQRYLKRNPNSCFAAILDGRIIGVILIGHDGRRGIIHTMLLLVVLGNSSALWTLKVHSSLGIMIARQGRKEA